jgi:hypothetical protein
MSLRILIGTILAGWLAACQNSDKTVATIKPVGCANSFTLSDYERIWLFDYDSSVNSLQIATKLQFDSVTQASYLCKDQTLAVSYSYRGPTKSRAGLDLIGEHGTRTISLNTSGANQFVPSGNSLFLGTAILRREAADPRLGYLAPEERADALVGDKPTSTKGNKQNANHVFVDLLDIDVRTASINRRLRLPPGPYIWDDGDKFIMATSTLLSLDKKSGVREEIYDFHNGQDYPYGKAKLYYVDAKFFTVTGGRFSKIERSSFKENTIYLLDPAKAQWKEIASLPFAPVHALGAGQRILIFGKKEVAIFSAPSQTLTVKPMDFASNVPLASAELESGIAVVLSKPVPGGQPHQYWGGEVVVFDRDLDRIQARRNIEEMGLPNLTSQRTLFPSGPTFNGL